MDDNSALKVVPSASGSKGVRCTYCNSSEHSIRTNSECRERYERFEKFSERYVYAFIALLLFSLVAFGILIFFTDPLIAMGIMFAIMGVTIAVFPFCTPETFEMLGVKGTIRLGRVLGLIMVVVGTAIACIVYLI